MLRVKQDETTYPIQIAALQRNDMKTLLAAAALAILGAVTVQAAGIFTCGGLGYAVHDGKVELVCKAPVTIHWTNRRGALRRFTGTISASERNRRFESISLRRRVSS
jgi:hypothetical protein